MHVMAFTDNTDNKKFCSELYQGMDTPHYGRPFSNVEKKLGEDTWLKPCSKTTVPSNHPYSPIQEAFRTNVLFRQKKSE